jgi:hypothetical protein
MNLFLIQFTMQAMLNSECVLDQFTMPSMLKPKKELCWTLERDKLLKIQEAVKQVQCESEFEVESGQ